MNTEHLINDRPSEDMYDNIKIIKENKVIL